jgi:hypothetical protein
MQPPLLHFKLPGKFAIANWVFRHLARLQPIGMALFASRLGLLCDMLYKTCAHMMLPYLAAVTCPNGTSKDQL